MGRSHAQKSSTKCGASNERDLKTSRMIKPRSTKAVEILTFGTGVSHLNQINHQHEATIFSLLS
jgi:hypothetical protein